MIDSDEYGTYGRPFTRLVATNILINHLKGNSVNFKDLTKRFFH